MKCMFKVTILWMLPVTFSFLFVGGTTFHLNTYKMSLEEQTEVSYCV